MDYGIKEWKEFKQKGQRSQVKDDADLYIQVKGYKVRITF